MLSAGDCIFRKSLLRFTAVDLLGMNPAWSGCTTDVMTPFNLSARILARSLISLCNKDMDPYEPGSVGSFNIKTMLAVGIEGGKTRLSLAALNTASN